jgi:glycosyltransferase involved in cell wall biosynthesis
MRVALLSKALVVGVYQRKCELIARHKDVNLTVLVPPAWRTGAHVTRLERSHTEGYYLREIPIWFNGNFHLHYYPTLTRELSQIQADVIHIDEEPYNLATMFAMRSALSLGAKTLFFSWQNLLRTYPPPFSWMERYVLGHADAAIAGNHDAVSVLRAKGYRGSIEVIPQFGVDEDTFHPVSSTDSRRVQGSFTIGYAGRIVREKGLDLLIQAVARLPAHVRLVLIGAGPEQARLCEMTTRLQVSDRVKFVSIVPSTEMPALYTQMDALVLPSRTQSNWKEQFGRVLIEAMACGVPVIGSTCGEIPQVIGDAGLIFAENDVEQLLAQLSRLIQQPALRDDLAVRGRARVLAQFSMQQIADQTVQVYRSIMHDMRD